jgi:hypothetical protein
VLTLYWRAGEPLPPEVAAVVANPGQPVSVFRADSTYGRSQLEGAAQGVADNTALSDQICAFIHTIKVLEEGSGLIVGVEPYDGTFNPFQAQQVLAAAAGVPVSIEVGPQTEYAARLNDVAPWFAGGGLTAGNTFCSAAFGVVDAGTRTREYMLTADHCFGLGVQVRNGNGTAILGPVALNRPQHDSEVIRVTAAGTNTFFGGVGAIGAPERNAPVRVPAANVRGVTVACTSGASTGENCALAVVATNAITMRRVIIGGRAFLQRQTNMVFASSTVRRANGQMAVAVGSGDSGGPVVTDTSHDREALGTISAGQNPVGCGIFAAPRKLCFSTVIYADINTLLRSYVAALR